MSSDQPAPTFMTAAEIAALPLPVTRGRYDVEPVDRLRLEAIASLEVHEKAARDMAGVTRRAQEAEAKLQRIVEAGGGDPFAGNARLLDQQRLAQQAVDRTVGNAKRWASEHTDRTRQRCADLVARAEQEVRTMLDDAKRTTTAATAAVTLPERTGDRATDAVNLARYVAAARKATDDQAATVHAELDERLDEALEHLGAAESDLSAARAELEGARRPRP